MNLVMRLFVVCAVFGFGARDVQAGHELGNGGDTHSYTDFAAWYLGPAKTIRVCFNRQGAFPYSAFQIERAIDGGFTTWKGYFAKNGLERLYTGQSPPTFRFTMIPRCDGSEDLRIEFGTESREIAR